MRKSIVITISTDKELKALAKAEGVTQTMIIQIALLQYLREKGGK